MSKNIWKILACIMAFGLLAYLIFVDYGAYQKQIVSQTEARERGKVGKSQDEAEIKEKDTTEVQTTAVVLCFDQFNEMLYEQLYPYLKDKQLTGIFVLENGFLPGDYKKISTRQCMELIESGWSVAVGGSSEFELTPEADGMQDKFDEYLSKYLDRIKIRTGIRPGMYCFYEGESWESYAEILKKNDITQIRSSSEEKSQQEGEFSIIKSICLKEETELPDLMDKIHSSDVVMLNMEIETTEQNNPSQELSMERFKEIVDQLQEEDGIQIVNLEQALELLGKNDHQ